MKKSGIVGNISAMNIKIPNFKRPLESLIKDLPKEFLGRGEVKGFIFSQISMTDKAFLYEVNSGDGIYYEVFKRKVNWRYGCISYPTSKAFGIYAWFYSDLDKARKKYDELNS